MTLAERVQLSRAEEQTEAEFGSVRVYCGCGCGVWWFRPKVEGRPRAYLNPEHYARERNRRRRAHA